jgi:hypothetical protein
MAVEFFSNGYDTTETNPYTEVPWADAHPSIGSARYGVRSPADWKVTAVSGADRTVSIAAGRGFGHGVTDKTVANETIQLDVVAGTAGTVRWDLIVCRRDWTPTGGTSQFLKVTGGATPVIPGGRLVGPGNIDDQPIALVPVIAGQTQPGTIIDLRTWSGDGGGIYGKDPLILSYLNSTGTRININGVDWIRRPGANDVPEWYCPDEPTILAPLSVAGYSLSGDIAVEPAGSKKRVTVDISVTRTGAAGTIPKDDWASFGAVIPAVARGGADQKYLPVSVIGGSTSTAVTNTHATVSLNALSGVLLIRGQSTFTWNTGALFTLNTTYYI